MVRIKFKKKKQKSLILNTYNLMLKDKHRLNGIIFSNYLRLPLNKYVFLVKQLKKYPHLTATQFHQAAGKNRDKNIIAIIRKSAKGIEFAYTHRELALLFRSNPHCSCPPKVGSASLIKRIRFVNTYNLLLYKILLYLIKKQESYFISGNNYDLKPQNTDQEIQREIFLKYGWKISLRGICGYRNSLYIPAWYKRKKRKDLSCCVDFSAEYLLTKRNYKKYIPSKPGIYVFKKGNKYFYVGSSGNLRKRIRTHLYNGSKNKKLSEYIRLNKCIFQYGLVNRDWKVAERHIYQDFIKGNAAPPLFNKMSPINLRLTTTSPYCIIHSWLYKEREAG